MPTSWTVHAPALTPVLVPCTCLSLDQVRKQPIPMRSTRRVCLPRVSLNDLPGRCLRPNSDADLRPRDLAQFSQGGSARTDRRAPPRLPLVPNPDKLRWVPTPSQQNAEARTVGYRMAAKGRATVKGNMREFHINPSDTFLARASCQNGSTRRNRATRSSHQASC